MSKVATISCHSGLFPIWNDSHESMIIIMLNVKNKQPMFPMEEFSFIDEFDFSDVAIGRQRPSETIRTWNDSELKSIVSGTGNGDGNGHEAACIVSICEGRGVLSEIGFSVFDLQSNLCHLIQVLGQYPVLNIDVFLVL